MMRMGVNFVGNSLLGFQNNLRAADRPRNIFTTSATAMDTKRTLGMLHCSLARGGVLRYQICKGRPGRVCSFGYSGKILGYLLYLGFG